MMITGMCSADVSAAEKKTVTDYQAYAANLDKSAYSGNDLGASYSKKATTFKVWSPNAASVRVNIFEHGSDDEGDAGSIMSRAMTLDKTTGVWSVTINGDLLNKYYTYSVTETKIDGYTTTIKTSDDGFTFTIINRHFALLPDTGGKGIMMFIIAGGLLLAFLLYTGRRKKRKQTM